MSSIVSSLTGGGGSGMGFRAQGVDLTNPVTQDQLLQSQSNVSGGLGQQEAFLKAVQAQNGLANQSNVFNQMQGVANGTGPNPAQAQLAQATGANVANQAALMAGQRGSGANAGMMARQIGQQGAGIQQNAAGQAATLQAQQSLNALNQMGGISTNQANQQANANNAYSNAALAAQQNQLGAVGAYNNAQMGMQSNINNANAGLAGNVAGQQGGMFGNLMGGMGSAMNLFGGGGGGAAGDLGAIGGGAETAGGAADMMDAGSMFGDGATMLAAEGGQVPEPSLLDTIQSAFSEDPKTAKPTPVKELPKNKTKPISDYFSSEQYAEGGPVSTPIDTALVNPNGPQSNVGKSFMQSQDNLGAYDPSATMAAPIAKRGGGGMSMPKMPTLDEMGKGIGQIGSAIGKNQFVHWVGEGLKDWGSTGSAFAGGAGTAMGAASGPMAGGAADAVGGAGTAVAAAAPYAAVAAAARGGEVPALVSPGETYLDPKDVSKVKKGASPLQEGEKIPGTPKVKGNSYENDTVPKQLEAGGIVIPNSIMQSKDAEAKAAAFVKAIIAKQGLKPSLKKGS